MTSELGRGPARDLAQVLGSQPLDPAHLGLADGLRLARLLEINGDLGAGGRRELLAARLNWCFRENVLRRRRGPAVGRSLAPDELLIGARIPGLPPFVWWLRRRLR
jgi:hypothetical protein